MRNFKIIILLIFSIFIASRTVFFKHGLLEDISSYFIYPTIYLSNKITKPIKTYFERKKNYKELLANYNNLKSDYEELLKENIKLKATYHYDQLSGELLDFQKRYNLKSGILAKVLAKNISEEEHSFLINRGSNSEIKKDMAVIYKFQLIGKITEVFSWYSKVLLITDSNCKVSAYANNTNSGGIVIGQNNINELSMQYTSHLNKIEKDDFVISSGKGLIFPEGFCLGKIQEFETKDLYHKIKITPLINLQQCDFCIIIDQEKIDVF